MRVHRWKVEQGTEHRQRQGEKTLRRKQMESRSVQARKLRSYKLKTKQLFVFTIPMAARGASSHRPPAGGGAGVGASSGGGSAGPGLFTVWKDLHPATGVEGAVTAFFTSPHTENLIVSRGSTLDAYSLREGKVKKNTK